jgi:hypothetical protein
VLFALSDPARLELTGQLATQGRQTAAQRQIWTPRSTFSHLEPLREAGPGSQ